MYHYGVAHIHKLDLLYLQEGIISKLKEYDAYIGKFVFLSS